ncbi:MAG: adenylyl-sulfate kinase [Chromatiales bacterium]
MAENVIWHTESVTRPEREQRYGHRSFALWFTGLSGAGKSTVAQAVQKQLFERECHAYVLDGDNVRHGLCGDLGFSVEDRHENIRRIGEMVKLFVDAGVIAVSAFISPLRQDRDRARSLMGDGDFIEVYCNCSINVCEQRDVKGLYKKARAGIIKEFTGISSPYEPPERPEIVLETDCQSLDESVQQVLDYLESRGLIPAFGEREERDTLSADLRSSGATA